MWKKTAATLLAAALVGATAGCARSGPDAVRAAASRGPITIWMSTNAQEAAWGGQMATAWNHDHPDQRITVRQVPAGKTSEEVMSASIIAGTSPCLVFNTAPFAVPQFQKQAGLVPLDDFPGADAYIAARSGPQARQYRSEDGRYYQMPWKSNPVMILYNKKIFAKAGLDPEHPRLATYREFLEAGRKIVRSGAAKAAIWPSPASDFFQSAFDYYPSFVAETGGTPLVKDGEPQVDSPAGRRVADFWRAVYKEKLAPQEAYPGDAMAEGKTAMATAGPWAIAAYQGKVDWGVVPVPTSTGRPAEQVRTFSDEKSIGMFSACKNRATAWDVLRFATSRAQDGRLLKDTGQMPMRRDLPGSYPEYFAKNPGYETFADQASRVVEAPIVAGSIDVWQAFRDVYCRSMIFGKQSPRSAMKDAAEKMSKILAEY